MNKETIPIYTKTYPCAVRFAFKQSNSQVAYTSISIKSGTRNEPQNLCGIAHLAEHMLFKGTSNRTPISINNRLEKLGGELNAYTTKEETVVYSSVLKEDIAKAIDLLFELVFTSTFPDKELQKEKSVVADEIAMYKDSPSECIFDDFEGYLFGTHPLSRSILGTSKSLKAITSEDLKTYTKENFTPQNIVITAVANLEFERVEKIVERCIAKYISPTTYTIEPTEGEHLHSEERCPNPLSQGVQFSKEVHKKNHQLNCIIGASAYSLYDKRRIPLILLTNILGGPSSNSRLNSALREKSALVYTVDASFNQYSDTGSVMIYFGCDKKNFEKCTALIERELSKLRENKLSDAALKGAKKQLLGQLAISSDNGEAQSLSMGKSLLAYNEIVPEKITTDLINSVTSEEILQVTNEIFAKERLSWLIYK